jgi:long-chain acyl-CoA synthetase
MKALETVRPTIMLTVQSSWRKSTVPASPDLSRRKKVARSSVRPASGQKAHSPPGGKEGHGALRRPPRFYGIGGAPLSKDVERFLIEAKFPYSVGYGLTETAPLLAGGDPADMEFRSTGKVLPGVSIRIADENENRIGEIQAKGPSIMEGYWKGRETNVRSFH